MDFTWAESSVNFCLRHAASAAAYAMRGLGDLVAVGMAWTLTGHMVPGADEVARHSREISSTTWGRTPVVSVPIGRLAILRDRPPTQ